MKSPFNWIGNKYTYIDIINKVVKEKKYNKVIDMFMGTGNILININVTASQFIGNDKNRLLPNIYKTIIESDEKFTLGRLNQILVKWSNFSQKEDYYIFRDYWNVKYKTNQFDRDFVYETALLLKMCSNSMVRFNKQDKFNQGFRGLGKLTEFFQESMKNLIVDGLNNLKEDLSKKNYKFINQDAINIKFNKDDLLIIDPPYILRQDMYNQDFTVNHDNYLLDIIQNNISDFIYFNYIKRDGETHNKLNEVLKSNNKLKVIELSNKTKSGQGSTGVKQVSEVLITNIGG